MKVKNCFQLSLSALGIVGVFDIILFKKFNSTAFQGSTITAREQYFNENVVKKNLMGHRDEQKKNSANKNDKAEQTITTTNTSKKNSNLNYNKNVNAAESTTGTIGTMGTVAKEELENTKQSEEKHQPKKQQQQLHHKAKEEEGTIGTMDTVAKELENTKQSKEKHQLKKQQQQQQQQQQLQRKAKEKEEEEEGGQQQQLQLSRSEQMVQRNENMTLFNSWFANGRGDENLRIHDEQNYQQLPILDFAVAGFPKCGSTTMMENLGHIAPMPVADVCVPVHQVAFYAYKNWPKQFGGSDSNNIENNDDHPKLYRGTKCPMYVNNAREIDLYLPTTKLIIGVRHPVLWFQSFWNMQATNNYKFYKTQSPYGRTKSCEGYRKQCSNHCPGQSYCVHRSRFHIDLAKLGKTPLSDTERQLLAANDFDGGDHLLTYATDGVKKIRNPIFLYEQTELSHDYVWESLATYLEYPKHTIPHDRTNRARGKKSKAERTDLNLINICDNEYDALRAMMMPYAYEMSIWICDYLIPITKDPNRNDVHVSNPDKFCNIVRDYKNDPCGRLDRNDDGTYTLKSQFRNETTTK